MMRVTLLLGLLISAACASTPFERHLAAGRWDQAAYAFRADSSLHDDPDALYRAAVVFASPDRETYDPATARALFARLVERHPGSKHTETALHYIELLDEILRARNASLIRERELEENVQRLQGKVTRLQSDIVILEKRIADQSHDAAMLTAHVAQLAASLKLCEEQLREARVELANLKAIDLRNAPRDKKKGTIDPPARR